jgi:spermidine/putrescine transport system ATP-binding protein
MTTTSAADRATGASSSGGSMLELDALAKHYGEFTAVHPLDLNIPAGQFFALLGPSGCGKTTTLRMVAGLDAPSAGSIRIGGTDITQLPAHKRPVNTVFQSYALFPHMSVFENVAFGLKRRRVGDWKARAQEFLELVELEHLANRKPTQLSGGQQQRVALARALVNKPEILLLDEPLGALDMKLRRQMQTELKRIQTDVGLTFVHVTHDQEEAMSMADTVAVMNAGRIEQLGPPQELYDLPRTAFVANFLGRSNLMPGTVVGRRGEFLEVDAAGHRVLLSAARAVSESGGVLVGVRPEKLDIRAATPGEDSTAENELAGTVTDTAFAGMSNEYHVEVPGLGDFAVFAQNRGAAILQPGDAVKLSWHPEHAFGLDGAEDADAGEES